LTSGLKEFHRTSKSEILKLTSISIDEAVPSSKTSDSPNMADGPDQIGPDMGPKKPFGQRLADVPRRIVKQFTTREGLLGDYDYAFLFTPNLPGLKRAKRAAPFFGLNDKMPIMLALVLGFQHALSMLAGVITPPIILAGQGGANLDAGTAQYLVSTSLIVCGILSSVQITRFHIYKTQYFIGTGLISVVGTSFATIPVASGAFAQMYASGFCPKDSAGNKLPCPQGYGAIIGTAAICALLEIAASFTRPTLLKKIFPPIVTGPTVALIGINLIRSGFQNWAGGSGTCASRPTSGAFQLCPSNSAPRPLPWGSAEFIGLGFLVFVTIIFSERFGSPIMKSCAVVVGLLVGCIVAGACGYFDRSGIDRAPAVSFIWVKTFPLSLYGPLVLPFLAVFIVLMMEAIG
jgi:uric acid-xanthine permease